MCHGRHDWTRAASEEHDEERASERWDVRARERLREAAGVDEGRDRPAATAEPPEAELNAEESESDDEREREEPVPADD